MSKRGYHTPKNYDTGRTRHSVKGHNRLSDRGRSIRGLPDRATHKLKIKYTVSEHKIKENWLQIATAMRAKRLEKGIARTELCKRIGVTRDTLYCWEVGKRMPGKSELFDQWVHELEMEVVVQTIAQRK
jgi:ribosome-binding protein aMBF1 (putative translation factor)